MATAKLLTDELDEVLSCQICLETYTQPVTLPCIHAFCIKCLEKYVTSVIGDGKVDGAILSCPTCRRETVVPDGGIDRFPPNYFINNLKDVVTSLSQTDDPCDLCGSKGDGNGASWRCIDCCKSLCDPCKGVHQRMPILVCGNHTVMPLNQWKNSDVAEACIQIKEMCLRHPTEVMKFYCTVCRSAICRDCHILDHSDHKCKDIEDVATEMKVKMKASLENLQSKSDDRRAVLEELSGRKSALVKKESDILDIVLLHKNALIKKISQYFQDIENFIKANMIDECKNIDLTIDELQSENTSLNSTIDLGKGILKFGRNSEILNATERLRNIENIENSPKTIHLSRFDEMKVKFVPSDLNKLDLSEICGKIEESRAFREDQTCDKYCSGANNERDESTVNTTSNGSQASRLAFEVIHQDELDLMPYSITVTGNGGIFLNDSGSIYSYSMNIRKAQLIKPQWLVDEWSPISITAYSKNSIIVSNWAHKDEGGGIYDYNHVSDKFTKMVSIDYPFVARMTRNNTVAIVRKCDNQYFKHAISLYNWNSGRQDSENEWCFTHSPRHVTFNQVSSDVIFTTCGGVTAYSPDNIAEFRWEYKDMEYPGGVCVHRDGDVFVADSDRIIILSRDGKYKSEINLSHCVDNDDYILGIAMIANDKLVFGTFKRKLYVIQYNDK